MLCRVMHAPPAARRKDLQEHLTALRDVRACLEHLERVSIQERWHLTETLPQASGFFAALLKSLMKVIILFFLTYHQINGTPTYCLRSSSL